MNKYLVSILVVFTLVFAACVDRTFDEPEFIFEDPALETTTTIASLKSTHVNGQYETLENGDIISGIVVANDKSGNYYETIVIADETAGIEIKINRRSLFNLFPVGRRVFVKLDGLVLGDYNELIQLGFSSTDNGFVGIPNERMDEFVIGGSLNNPFQIDTLTVSQLNENYMSMVVTVKNAQFVDAELGKTYADAVYKETSNRNMEGCSGGEVILRTSGYASFAGNPLPQGSGTITAVLSRYRDDFQLFLRDTTDINFDQMRCGAGTGNETTVDIIDLRNDYLSGTTSIGDDLKLEAVVISDLNHGNLHENNCIIQDGTGGIVLRFSSAHNFELGDQLEIVVSNMELSDYNGLLQINNMPIGAVTHVGNEEPAFTEATVGEILSNAESWESTLVKLTDVSISGGNTFGDGLTVSDNSGSIDLYTRSQADFAGEEAPSVAETMLAIVGDFNGPQLNLRSLADVEGGSTGPCTPEFNKDFEDLSITSGCWSTQLVIGDAQWEAYEFSGEKFARISNFNGESNVASESWLISPQVDLSEFDAPVLSFRTACNYEGPDIEIYISDAYDGDSSPDVADWTNIAAPISSGDWTWVESGKLDLTNWENEMVHVAFRYLGSDSDGKTWEVDDIVLAEKQGGGDLTIVFEDGFSGGLNAWTAYNVTGTQVWEHSTQYGNPDDCARVSGFDGQPFENEDWLISPAIDLTDASDAEFEFETAKNYTGNSLEVLLSADYSGSGDPNNATWEKINPTLSTGGWEWIGSGSIDLGNYLGGEMYFAFKFTSTNDESATWEVDNVSVAVASN